MENNKFTLEQDACQNIELHNREVMELLGDPPDWLIKSGSYLLYGFLIIIISAAAFISYPDVVRGTVFIDDLANVEWITVNSSGQIESFFVEDGSFVNIGDTIAIMQNPAQISDIKKFCRILTNVEQYYLTNNSDLLRVFHFDLSMGEMAVAYENFTKAARNCLLYDDHNYLSQRKAFLEKELNILKREAGKNELAIIKTERDIFELIVNHKMEFEKNRKQLELAYEDMINNIRIWESKYLIQSHSEGRIVLGEVRALMRMLNKGDTIGSIISNKKEELVAKINLDQEQIGEIKPGNQVNIRLSKYPEHTFGMLVGKVNSIIFVPYKKQYVVDILFNDMLVTTTGKNIKYSLGLKGEAEIITSSRSVLSRIFGPINKLYNKKNKQ